MSNASPITIAVPTTVGAFGASVNVSTLEPEHRTFCYKGTTGDIVEIWGSMDDTNFSLLDGFSLRDSADVDTVTDRCLYYKAKRVAGTAAATLKLCGGDYTAPSQTPTYWKHFALQGAAAAIAETVIAVIPANQKLVTLAIRPDAALTAHDTNFATITLSSRSAAGGSKSTLGSITTKITGGTGNWTAFVDVAIPITGSQDLTDGMIITAEAAQAASGVALPGMQMYAECRQP